MAFRFQSFPFYPDVRNFVKKIYLLSSKLPSSERFELASQLRRAAVSVSLNIAEGSAKLSDADFNRFIMISIGSLSEITAILDIMFDLSLIDAKTRIEYTSYCETLAKRLYGFSKKLKS